MGVHIDWKKCRGNAWCSLAAVELEDRHFDDLTGVYIIWHGKQQREVLRVGSGNIREVLGKERKDRDILTYIQSGLYVTWARVEAHFCSGVARYLLEALNPKFPGQCPASAPIQINLPWSEVSFPWDE